MRTLQQYVDAIKPLEVKGSTDMMIRGITQDSRKAAGGSIFVATKGNAIDAHNFIPDAVNAGCQAIVCEVIPPVTDPRATYVKVTDSAMALGLLASFHHGHPSRKLKLVGVTGTNGKTTIATLLYRMAQHLGYKAGLCSTIANYVDKERIETSLTTPDVLTLNQLLGKMVDGGCQYCFIEVSSHSVIQKRVAGLKFAGGVFTNLSHDHLDYHGTIDAYLKAKKGFFDGLDKESFALTNIDDKTGPVMLQNCRGSKYTYSTREMASYRVKVIETHIDGMQLEIDGREVWSPLVGGFNASNLAAVHGTAMLLGWDKERVITALSGLRPVDGRFETIRSFNGVTVVVDYAHTPDALTNVLTAIKQVIPRGKELITVVGAGGNRDPYKRPKMAAEAVKFSNRVILTSDNPRHEEPDAIISQMIEGVLPGDRVKVICITNREEAIKAACSMAKPGDMVLIAGKGHETYQEIKGTRTHFDDREIARDYFKQLEQL